MKITTVIENVSNKDGLVAEHGLCLFVEANESKILVDTGASELAYQNFCTLKLNANDVETIVISHNHYDHIGGLQRFLDHNKKVKFTISSKWDEQLFSKQPFHKAKLISCNEVVNSNLDRAIFVEDQIEIARDVFVCRVKNPIRCFVCKDKRLKKKIASRFVKDDFLHETYLAIIENGTLKIISSCTHNGVVNVIEDAKSRFENVPISTLVGGLHFKGRNLDTINCSKRFLNDTISYLNNSDLTHLFTCHCTGQKAFEAIDKHCVLRTVYLNVGDAVEV